jgi:putative endopeptidase
MYKIIIICLLFVAANAYSQKDPVIESMRGINKANFDESVLPCQDFYQYVNGNWLKNNPVPPEFPRWGNFIILDDENNKICKSIEEEATQKTNLKKGSNYQIIGDLYATAMDSAKIESLGYTPLKPYLDKINAIATIPDLNKLIGYLSLNRFGGVFSLYAGQDEKSSEDIILQMGQGGLTLPERDYYTKDDEKSIDIRNKYFEHVKNVFKLLGLNEADAFDNANIIIKIETRLAKASMTRVEMRDPEATYHKMYLTDLQFLTPDFNWTTYFNEMGLIDSKYFSKGLIVGQPDFFKEFNTMLKDVSINEWKVYFTFHLVNSNSGYLSSPFVEESFKFNGQVLSGQKAMQPRWKRMTGVVNRSAGELLGQLYVEKMFSPKAKERAKEMVSNIMASLKNRIENLSWMSAETKKAALYKLSKIVVKIGYPDKWKDFSGLEISRNSFFDNVVSAQLFNYKKNLDKIGKPVDRDEWGMTPQTVNAYYSAQKNEIVFPAAILQPPFFDAEADDALNYGGIGAVIGHEISHGFDDQGRKFDAEGNMKDWWTKDDETKYNALTDKIVEQFNEYALDKAHVNGKMTLGENIGDLGGLTVSYYALEKSLEGKEKKLIDGFTPEQRFFISWAQVWRLNQSPERDLLQINTDSHSPSRFRVNGPYSNMLEFINAFGCKDSDSMMRAKDKIVTIW